jgi:Fe-S cluster assembly protein SufD
MQVTMSRPMPNPDSFAAQIRNLDPTCLPAVPALDDLRQNLWQRALDLGLPTRRIEAWHYTDLARLLDRPSAKQPSLDVVGPLPDMPQIKFSGGAIEVKDASGLNLRPILESPTLICDVADHDAAEAMLAFNLALLAGGAHLRVAEGAQEELCVVYEGDGVQHLRHAIHVEAGATLTLLEIYRGGGYGNVVSDITIDAGGVVNHIKLHTSGAAITLTRATLGASARYVAHHVIAGEQVARHESRINLDDAAAHASLSGALLARAGAHQDVTSVISHNRADTSSETQIRSLVDATARAVFQGKVVVARDAQRVDAQQQSRALLLAENAEMNVKPELEIYADDVACAHGSTVGALDKDALFFLRSRGIPETVARQMLVRGFLSDVTETLPEGQVADFIAAHLDANLELILNNQKRSV